MMHNHGPEEGPGLSCPERRLPDGTLQGRCMEEFEPYQVVFAHESLARRFEEWVNSFPGLTLTPPMRFDKDDIAARFITPTEEAWRATAGM